MLSLASVSCSSLVCTIVSFRRRPLTVMPVHAGIPQSNVALSSFWTEPAGAAHIFVLSFRADLLHRREHPGYAFLSSPFILALNPLSQATALFRRTSRHRVDKRRPRRASYTKGRFSRCSSSLHSGSVMSCAPFPHTPTYTLPNSPVTLSALQLAMKLEVALSSLAALFKSVVCAQPLPLV